MLPTIVTIILLLTTIPLYYPLPGHPFKYYSSEKLLINDKCDIFDGEWVPNPEGPYYTNTTCWSIHKHQNCMKYGRPDSEYMKWKWKPHGCDLEVFEPRVFLETMRGKAMAFVGDSVARNQMQSLICLLSRVEYPVDVSYTSDDYFRRWKYPTYNFTLAAFTSSYLVRSKEIDPIGPTHNGLFNLYLDEYDAQWATEIEEFNFLIISTGHPFFRPLMYYEKRHLIGCSECLQDNVTDLPPSFGYKKAFHTTFKKIINSKNFRGITFLRTFAPSHFEGGKWNTGGKCLRKRPFRNEETRLDGVDLEFYSSQMEEFMGAKAEAEKRGLKFRVLDTTKATLLRPDGHPSTYGHWPHENVTLYNDCVHWCLPGPIDIWNDLLLEMLKREARESQ